MPIVKLRSLGKYGVVTDIPPFDLPPEAWSDSNNIRFTASHLEKMNGFAPTLKPSEDKSEILYFAQEPDTKAANVIYATKKNVYLVEGTQHTLINEDDGTTTNVAVKDKYNASPQLPWNGTTLSNVIVLNNTKDNPVGWIPKDPTRRVLQPLPGWGKPTAATTTPIDWKCRTMRSYKSYLLALNMTEAGVPLPQRVRWSDVAQTNNLPPNWIQDSQTTDGGFIDLTDCVGSIVDGRPLRDYFFIYTDRETYIMRYVGGDFVFDVQKLYPDAGLLNPNCVVEYEGGNHFVVSGEDIFTHDGSTRQSIANDLVKERILTDITSIKYEATKVFSFPSRKEIWVCYVSKTVENGNDDNFALDKAAVWNWQYGTWTFTDLPDVYWMDSIISPNVDLRDWNNPGADPTVTPTEITLDVPFDSLPVGFPFRVDVLYKPGEALQTGETLEWTSSDPTIADFTQDKFDQSATLTPHKDGAITITVAMRDSQGTLAQPGSPLYGTFPVTITAAGTPAVLRHQLDDTPAGTRPNQYPDANNQWDATPKASATWDKKGFTFATRSFIATSRDTSFYEMDVGDVQERFGGIGKPNTVIPVPAFIKHAAISMTNNEIDLSYHKTWRILYPLIAGEGTLTFIIGGSNDPYTDPVQDERQDYVIGTDYKVDCFTNYRYLYLEIRDENKGDWSLSGMDIDYFLGGKI